MLSNCQTGGLLSLSAQGAVQCSAAQRSHLAEISSPAEAVTDAPAIIAYSLVKLSTAENPTLDPHTQDVFNLSDCVESRSHIMHGMQAAFFVGCDPSKPGFWGQVARHVPGKSAQQCFDHHFGEEPAQEAEAARPKKLPQYLQAPGAAPMLSGTEPVMDMSCGHVTATGCLRAAKLKAFTGWCDVLA